MNDPADPKQLINKDLSRVPCVAMSLITKTTKDGSTEIVALVDDHTIAQAYVDLHRAETEEPVRVERIVVLQDGDCWYRVSTLPKPENGANVHLLKKELTTHLTAGWTPAQLQALGISPRA